MTSRYRTVLVVFIIITTLLVCFFPFLPVPEEPMNFLVFLGRFHPLLLHFPIVLVLLTLIFEGLDLYQQSSQSKSVKLANISLFIGPLLLVSVICTLVTVVGGFLLFRSGDYQGELVRQHLWGGVLLMIALNGATLFYMQPGLKTNQKIRTTYRGFLVLAGALVMVTSHLGGSLTHGQDFLTEHLPTLKAEKPAPIEQKEPKDLLVFQDLILPILEDKCQNCHNQYKTKGGLIMTSYANLLKGGESEKPLLVANMPAESELYHRITLPNSDDDKMPPPEKAPVTQDEIELIKWWILIGADEDIKLGENPPDSISLLLDGYLPKLFQSERLKMRQQEELDELAEELAELGEEIGLVIEPDPKNPGFFSVSMQIPPASITNESVTHLRPYAGVFSKISLPGADIDDDALFEIGKMANLRELYIPKTCVNGEGLVYLEELELLENINLSNSELSNEGILNLIHLPEVKRIYVWGSETDTLVLQALRTHLPEIEILEEEGSYF